jgi:hypothetical protein
MNYSEKYRKLAHFLGKSMSQLIPRKFRDSLNWFDYTTEDGLASDCAYSVFVEGSGASMRIWVGTALGASKGHF